MSQTDLLGDPLPDPLPEGERFTRMEQLVGHTIKAVFEDNRQRLLNHHRQQLAALEAKAP